MKTARQHTQRVMILTALRQGDELTPLNALARFGCSRLAARIYDLRNEGFQITSKLTWDALSGSHYSTYKMAV